jgi:hypothetical protein
MSDLGSLTLQITTQQLQIHLNRMKSKTGTTAQQHTTEVKREDLEEREARSYGSAKPVQWKLRPTDFGRKGEPKGNPKKGTEIFTSST